MHNRFELRLLALTLFCTALGGCVAPQLLGPLEESEVIPPLPTFLTVQDCEMAYGAGACGTGSQIYGQASLAAPSNASSWYMPHSFGAMTGALLHDHYAPPGIYLAQVPYRSYLQPSVIQRYAMVNPQNVRFYRSAPHPFQGGAHSPPAWHWQPRYDPMMRYSAPRQLNLPPMPPMPPMQSMPPVPLTKPAQPVPQKPSPTPAFVNPPSNPGQRPDRFDRADRPDRPDRHNIGNSGSRMSDRKPEERK